MITILICTNSKFAYHDFIIINKSIKELSIRSPKIVNSSQFLIKRNVGNCLTVICHSSVFNKIKFSDCSLKINEDLWTFYFILKKIKRGYGIPITLGTQYISSNSVSSNKFLTSKNFFKVLLKQKKLIFFLKLKIIFSYIYFSLNRYFKQKFL